MLLVPVLRVYLSYVFKSLSNLCIWPMLQVPVLREYLSYITSSCHTYVVYIFPMLKVSVLRVYLSYITSHCPTYVVYNNNNNRCQTFNLSYCYKSLSNVYIYLSYVTSPCSTCPILQVPVQRMSCIIIIIIAVKPSICPYVTSPCPTSTYICPMLQVPVLRVLWYKSLSYIYICPMYDACLCSTYLSVLWMSLFYG